MLHCLVNLNKIMNIKQYKLNDICKAENDISDRYAVVGVLEGMFIRLGGKTPSHVFNLGKEL